MLRFNEDKFYSIDYEDEEKKLKYHDPLSTFDQPLYGKKKSLNKNTLSGFDSSTADKTLSYFDSGGAGGGRYPTPPRSRISKTESEIAPIVEGSKYKGDYGWWRGDSDYEKWLNSKNLDPVKLDDFQGNKLYKDYIQYKAENQGLISDISGGLGRGMKIVTTGIQGVSDMVSKVPGVGLLVKPAGTVMQFIGNLWDAPRNIIAGAVTALYPGHPEELIGNIWEAIKGSASASVGNEGKHFSYMDGVLRDYTDKLRQGIGDTEYKNYVHSDQFRQTQRLIQASGLLLDLALDPAWLMGAFETKALKATKEMGLQRTFIEGMIGGAADAEKLPIFMDAVSDFHKGTKKLLDFVGEDKKFAKTMGYGPALLANGTIKNVDAVKIILDKFADLSKADPAALKPFEYAMRVRVPFTKGAVSLKIGPSIQPLRDAIVRKIGGYARGVMSVASRTSERAEIQIGTRSNVNEILFKTTKEFKAGLDDIAHGADKVLAEDAVKALNDPEIYKELITSLIESPDSPVAALVNLPTGVDLKATGLFGLHEPLLENLLGRDKVSKLKQTLVDRLAESKAKLSGVEIADLKDLQAMGMSGNDAYVLLKETVGERKSVLQNVYKRTVENPLAVLESPKMAPQFVGVIREIMNGDLKGKELFSQAMNLDKNGVVYSSKIKELMKLTGDINANQIIPTLTEAEQQFVKSAANIMDNAESAGVSIRNAIDKNYTPRIWTLEAQEYMKKSRAPMESVAAEQLAADFSRSVTIPSDLVDGLAAKKVFLNPDELKMWKKTMAADPEMAMLEINDATQRLFHSNRKYFDELMGMSNQANPATGNLLTMAEARTHTSLYVANDVKPLFTQASVEVLNNLSKKGQLIKGFTGQLYETGLQPFYRKFVNDQKMVERLNGASEILRQGQMDGWIKRVASAQEKIDLPLGFEIQEKGIFKGFAVQDYLVKPMQNALKAMFDVADAQQPLNWVLQGALNGVDGFNQWWKVNIYLKNIGAHVRNFLNNRMMMMGDGVGPLNFMSQEGTDGRKVWRYNDLMEKAQKALRDGKEGKFASYKAKVFKLGEDTVNVAGKKMSIMEASEVMMNKNVASAGLLTDILADVYKGVGIEDFSKLEKANQITKSIFSSKYNLVGKKDIWALGMRNVASFTENALARNEYWLTLINKKGYSLDRAASRVNEILVDYGRMSRTENAVKKYLIPFYSWQSRMIPVMLQKAIEQPAYFTKLAQWKNDMYNILELDKNFAPQGEQIMEGMPIIAPQSLGKFFAGKPLNEVQTQYISGEGWLPQAVVNLFDFNLMGRLLKPIENDENFITGALGNLRTAVTGGVWDVGKGLIGTAINRVGPLPKVLVEAVSGYSFQFERMLKIYPDQTVRYCGQNMSPEAANVLRSMVGPLRYVNDMYDIFDKNAITGRPKFTAYDILIKNLLGWRPYERNEIREINGALGEASELYRGNLNDARKMVYDKAGQEKHAYQALMAYHAIQMLTWYKDFATEVRDKEATMKGIQASMDVVRERLKSPHLTGKNRAALERKNWTLFQRMEAFNADLEK